MKRRAFKTIDPKLVHTTTVKVTFDMLDPMNVVYHGVYPRLLEAARSELLEAIGWGYIQMREAGTAFPVTDMQFRFCAPAGLGCVLYITAGVMEWNPKLIVCYEIRMGAVDGPLLTRAETVQMPVRISDMQTLWEAPEAMKAAFIKHLGR